MAARSTCLRIELPMQQRESQSRAKWTTSLTKTMLDLMLDQVHKGHKQNKSFSRKGWKCICDDFHIRTGLKWGRVQLKNRYDALKKQFATVKLLLDHSDFSWEEHTGLITATDEAWDRYIKDHPDAESIRSTGCPFYKELTMILQPGTSGTCNGSTLSHSQPSAMSQEELSSSESEDGPDLTNEQEILQSVNSPTDINRKRRRKGVDDNIAKAMSEMAAASRLRASVIKECNEKFTITDCIRALDELDNVTDQVYYAALDLFNHRAARETFLSLKVGKRLTWLIGKLSGPP